MDRRQVMQTATGAMSLVAISRPMPPKADARPPQRLFALGLLPLPSASVAGRTPEEVARDKGLLDRKSATPSPSTATSSISTMAMPAPRPCRCRTAAAAAAAGAGITGCAARYLTYSDMGPIQTMVNVLYPQIERVRQNLAQVAELRSRKRWRSCATPARRTRSCRWGHRPQSGRRSPDHRSGLSSGMLTTSSPARAARQRIKLVTVSFPVPVTSSDDLYNRIANAVTPKTKLILICHITNRTGVILLPAQTLACRRICDMAHAKGIHSGDGRDGAHAFNPFPFPKLSDLNCDYYGVSLHKWTCAPIGTGFLYVRKSRIAQTWSLMASEREKQGERHPKISKRFGTHPAANPNATVPAKRWCSTRRYRHRAQGSTLALSARPLGGTGCAIMPRCRSCTAKARSFRAASALSASRASMRARCMRRSTTNTISSPPGWKCRASMTACASRRMSTQPCAMSIHSRTRWRRYCRRLNYPSVVFRSG